METLLLQSCLHPILFGGCVLVLIFLLHKWLLSNQNTSKASPPSPPKLPIFGHLLKLGRLPHITLQNYARRYGPLFLLHLGTKPTIVVSSPQLARDIMKTHDLTFANRPKSSMADKLLYGSKDIAMSPYGEYWRRMRSIGVLRLLSHNSVQSFRCVREQEVKAMIDNIQHNPISVNLTELFSRLTNDVICRVAFGRKYGIGQDGSKLRSLLLQFGESLASFIIRDYVPLLGWIDGVSGFDVKAKRVAKELDVLLDEVIEDHIHLQNRAELKDLMDILLSIQAENSTGFPLQMGSIKALILDMFAAGVDSTYAALEWAMSELLKHPESMKKLKGEMREIMGGKGYVGEEDVEKMHYLKAIIKETLRLHPPLPLLFRESSQSIKVKGYDINPGTRVMINVWAIGRDPEVWEEAEEFRPERFMTSSMDFKGQNMELIPFGAGRRGCPGIAFAMAMIEMALANVVHKFEWKLPNGAAGEDLDMTGVFGLAIHREFPLVAIATSCC
ncbi:cytochrome P450 71A3-like [Cucurbita maxima]|uniref:Cytochrome P450 71A3-like n=1 Tax=Cucurbita maxima TaxID=3661 RepID=A0A6J1IEF5_CUCMA|nr:cytochrome P450 71A3-like [Cucurbita maxima]